MIVPKRQYKGECMATHGCQRVHNIGLQARPGHTLQMHGNKQMRAPISKCIHKNKVKACHFSCYT